MHLLGTPIVDSAYAFERFQQRDFFTTPKYVTGIFTCFTGYFALLLSLDELHSPEDIAIRDGLLAATAISICAFAFPILKDLVTTQAIDREIIQSIEGAIILEVAQSLLYATITAIALAALFGFGFYTALAIGLGIGSFCLLDTALYLYHAFYDPDHRLYERESKNLNLPEETFCMEVPWRDFLEATALSYSDKTHPSIYVRNSGKTTYFSFDPKRSDRALGLNELLLVLISVRNKVKTQFQANNMEALEDTFEEVDLWMEHLKRFHDHVDRKRTAAGLILGTLQEWLSACQNFFFFWPDSKNTIQITDTCTFTVPPIHFWVAGNRSLIAREIQAWNQMRLQFAQNNQHLIQRRVNEIFEDFRTKTGSTFASLQAMQDWIKSNHPDRLKTTHPYYNSIVNDLTKLKKLEWALPGSTQGTVGQPVPLLVQPSSQPDSTIDGID